MRILLTISLIILAMSKPASAGQTLKEIMAAPADSADRENLRIWVPIERRSKCKLTVDILDSDNNVIRHLVDILAGPGYYNFYWDKKTDSGAFADTGSYKFKIDDCSNEKTGQLSVFYKSIIIEVNSPIGYFSQEIEAESIHLKIERFSMTDSLIATIIDTTLDTGFHKLSLPEITQGYSDSYIQQIQIDGKVVERKTGRTKEKNE